VKNPLILGIVGPTAVGKSAVAERVATALGGEIVYRGMDIGTAKTPPAERAVVHHCLDLVDPGTPYSAALYQRDARGAIESAIHRGLTPVLAGGTGLYVRAALDEMDFPAGDQASKIRAAIEDRLAGGGANALYAELAAVDPSSARLIHPNNVRRVVRAMEMHLQGDSYAEQAAGFARREFHYSGTLVVGLDMDRAALYERIDRRVDDMLASGLIAEVRRLLDRGLLDALTAAQAIGYKELVPVVREAKPRLPTPWRTSNGRPAATPSVS